MSPDLLQLKSYLKIIDIPYIMEGTNISINSSCCGNHLSQRQMITQAVNLLVGY